MVRLQAIQALGDCGDIRALPALRKIQQNDKVACHGYDLSLEVGSAIDFILEREAKKPQNEP
jgi:HEAT repeat protein